MIGSLEINTVVGCVNRCAYCPQDLLTKAYQRRSEEKRMTFETFSSCLAKVPKNISIHFSGMAEPFLNPGCCEMIAHAAGSGYDVEVYTTLVGMPLDAVEMMEKVRVSKTVVHLPSPAHANRIVVEGGYLEKLRRLTDSSLSNIIFISIGAPDPRFERIVRQPIRVDSPIDRAGNLDLKDAGKPEGGVRKRGRLKCNSCGDRLNHNVLMPNGDVLLCCMDYGMQHVLGNLRSSPYESLFRSRAYLRVHTGLSDGTVDVLCRKCHNSKEIDIRYRIGRQIRRFLGIVPIQGEL